MRQGSDSGWDDLWATAPLTGREPILGRLRLRLKHGPRGGWVGVSGPRGAGVSRVLAEATSPDERQPGAPRPLRITPVRSEAPRFEAVRRALLPWRRQATPEALRAALAPVVPRVGGGAAALLAWLDAGPLAAGACLPPLAVLRAALAALADGGVLVADDWDALDAETRRLLLDLSQGGSTILLAGVSHPGTTPPPTPGTTWPLEPLAEAQVELLLRRWLHAPVAARRLAPELARHAEGWPGRVVALVRGLALGGALERTARGIAVAAWPTTWTPVDERAALLKRWRARGAATWRVVESASLLAEPCEPDLLAEAAGVKRALVEDLVAEAVAARGGRDAGCLFGDPALQRSLAQRLSPSRRAQAALRWARAFAGREAGDPAGLGHALARLEALAGAPGADGIGPALAATVRALPRAPASPTAVLDLLERAADRARTTLGADAVPALLATAARLGEAGRVGAAGALLDAVAAGLTDDDQRRAWHTLRLRFGAGPERADVRARLLALLPGSVGSGHDEAWRALAEDAHATPLEARAAWRGAIRALAPCDMAQRALLHARLGDAAACRGARRAATAHGRRAAALLEALGRTGEAAARWTEVGLRESEGQRWRAAEAAFGAAVRAWRALGEAGAEGPALEAQAHAAVRLDAHDEAVSLLERSLACAEACGQVERRASVHLALARAHRARGDVGGERRHAGQALEHAATTETRLAARAAWLMAQIRAGEPAAVGELERLARELEAVGMAHGAHEARDAAADARLRAGSLVEAERLATGDLGEPRARLYRARLERLKGRPEQALVLLDALGRDPDVPVELRAEAYARLAELQVEQARTDEAGRSAQAAAALLEVPRRSRAEDPRLHRLLARVFRGVGARARSVEHRAAARRTLRLPSPGEVAAPVRRRMVRALWLDDPRPATLRAMALAV